MNISVKRVSGLLAILTVSVVTLTGCLTVDADVTVNSDASATGEINLEVSSEFAGLIGATSSEEFVTLLQSGEIEGAESAAGFDDCEPLEVKDGVAVKCSFVNLAFTDPEGLWNISSDQNSVTFNSKQGEQESTDNALLPEGIIGGGYAIRVTMPGSITSISGDAATKTSDNTFEISSSLTDAFDVSVTSENGSASSSPLWIFLLAGAAIIVIVLVIFLMLRNSKKDTEEEVVEEEIIIEVENNPKSDGEI